jgi:hypothetical protein
LLSLNFLGDGLLRDAFGPRRESAKI